MKRIITKNNKPVLLKDIPELDAGDFRNEVIGYCSGGKRIIAYFGMKFKDAVRLIAVMADDHNSQLHITSTSFTEGGKYESMTHQIGRLGLFERELYEEYGIEPAGHPWLKPVKYPYYAFDRSLKMEDYPFFRMQSEEIHEVGVGPVHAGIIEPGHFRFLCSGEKVHHLEIQLGYQHRGAERLFEHGVSDKMCLAESIAGDTVIGHGLCYAGIVESLSGANVPKRALSIRGIACELERIAMHIADLSALSNDVAYIPGSANFGAVRTIIINTLLDICGNRFGRGLLKTGGVNFDIDDEMNERIISTLDRVNADVEMIGENLFTTPSVLSRFEKTGIVDTKTAAELGLVGPAARASGIPVDVRTDHPSGNYEHFPVYSMTMDTGDVFARAYVRYAEIIASIKYVKELLDNFYSDGISKEIDIEKLMPGSLVVSMIEGWRGEIAHCCITDKKGNIVKYKIKDPSFNNWMGLAMAVRNNGISDFPLCNKSFNLSYCGYDL